MNLTIKISLKFSRGVRSFKTHALKVAREAHAFETSAGLSRRELAKIFFETPASYNSIPVSRIVGEIPARNALFPEMISSCSFARVTPV